MTRRPGDELVQSGDLEPRFSAGHHDSDEISSNSSSSGIAQTTSELSSASTSQNDTQQILRGATHAFASAMDNNMKPKQGDASAEATASSAYLAAGNKWAQNRALNPLNHPNLQPALEPSSKPDDNHQNQQQSIKLLVALFLIGLIVCVSSLVCILMLPTIVSNQIAKKLVLKNNSMLLERWSKPNVPMYFKVWLYDIKNAQEIIDKRDTKPEVAEIGPFVFNLRRKKDVISFAGDNLYYTERKIYHFNRELSCCAINTTVTIPNIPLVAVVDRALSYNLPLVGRFIPRLINRAISSLREQLFVRKQVREILFDGYDVELLRMVSRVGSLVGLPQQSQKFALLKGRNDSWRPEQDGVWAINTGQRDRKQFGRVSSWNSYKRLPFWPAAQCNVINGSDGTLFPPPIKSSEPLFIFNQELCRTVNLVYERPSDVHSIKALRFVLNPMNFARTMSPGSSRQHATATLATANNPAGLGLTGTGQQLGQPQRTRLSPLLQSPRGSAQPPAPVPLDPVSALLAAVPPRLPPTTQSAALASAPTQRQPPVDASNRQPGLLSISQQHNGGRLTTSASSESVAFSRERPPGNVNRSPHPANAHAQSGALAANHLHSPPSVPENSVNEETNDAKVRDQQERLILAAQDEQLAHERKSPMNPQTCFCDRKTTNLNGVNVCEFDGLIDLSKCSKQAQVIFGSSPHFYNADARLLRQVVGLQPNATKHTTYLDIEPNTGLVLGGKRRVQLNLIIKHNKEIDGFENINDMLVPVIWFEESALIPEETAQKFRSIYVDKIRTINVILFSLLVASIALLAIDARLLFTSRRWREFKLKQLVHLAAPSAPVFDRGRNRSSSRGHERRDLSGSRRSNKQKAARGQTKGARDERSRLRGQNEQPPPKTQTTGAGLKASQGNHQADRLLERSLMMASTPMAAAARLSAGNANKPLLEPSSNSATTTAPASSGSSPGSTPPESPELGKWWPRASPGGQSLSKARTAHNSQATTRIYVSTPTNHKVSTPKATQSGRPAPSGLTEGAGHKSIIELDGARNNVNLLQ